MECNTPLFGSLQSTPLTGTCILACGAYTSDCSNPKRGSCIPWNLTSPRKAHENVFIRNDLPSMCKGLFPSVTWGRMIRGGKHKGECLHSHHKTFKLRILWLQVSSLYSQTLLKLYLILDLHTLSSPLDMLSYVIRNLDLWVMTCLWPHL